MAEEETIPLLEIDPAMTAVVEPSEAIAPVEIPQAFVISFFRDAIDRFVAEVGARVITTLGSEMGSHPVYEVDAGDRRVGLALGGVGAAFAAGWLEELIARGAR